MIYAINGRTGSVIWSFRELEVETNSPIVMDLYTINVLRDLDGDSVPEVIAAHLEEREESKAGHIKLISGKTGKVIRSIPTPYREEMFVPIQLITQADGTELHNAGCFLYADFVNPRDLPRPLAQELLNAFPQHS